MTIRFKCDQCGVAMKIKDELAGKKGKCPQCKNTFVIPDPDVEEDEYIEEEESEEEEEWDEDEEDDDLLDMPLELTSAPVTTPPPPAEMPRAAPRDRKRASESKKATRISKPAAAKSKDGGFDPTDVLFDDDGSGAGSPPPAAPPRGRVLGLDDEDDDDDGAPASSSMADMFKDFTPKGGKKKEAPSVASTSVAAQALARKAEEKRNKSSAPPPVEEDEGTDYVGALKEVWDQYKLAIIGFGVLLMGAIWMGQSVMGGGKEIPDLYEIEGIVTQRGTPVVGAEITFTPIEEPNAKQIEGRIGGSCFSSTGGEYYVMYDEDYEGLPAGKYRVDVRDNGRMLGSQDLEITDRDVELNLQF